MQEETRINRILVAPGIVFEQVYVKIPDRFNSTGWRWKQEGYNIESFERLYQPQENRISSE